MSTASIMGMTHSAQPKRSHFYKIIAGFHPAVEKRLARLDFVGALASGVVVLLLMQMARILVSR